VSASNCLLYILVPSHTLVHTHSSTRLHSYSLNPCSPLILHSLLHTPSFLLTHSLLDPCSPLILHSLLHTPLILHSLLHTPSFLLTHSLLTTHSPLTPPHAFLLTHSILAHHSFSTHSSTRLHSYSLNPCSPLILHSPALSSPLTPSPTLLTLSPPITHSGVHPS
jgi:hypothetical protein